MILKKYCWILITTLFVSNLCLAQESLKPPGVVVDHLSKETGKYIGSPGLCILPDGTYVASHDEFGPKSTEFRSAKTCIFISKDKGESWKPTGTIDGQFWSNLFVHNNELYVMGTNKHHGNFILRKSTDLGYTWTVPTDKNSGLILEGEYHTAPMPVTIHGGRIWRALEYATASTTQWGKRYSAMMISAPADADLLDAGNWQKTNYLRYDSTYLNGKFEAWLEGNAVVGPNGDMLDILRVAVPAGSEEYAAIVQISKDGKRASFDPQTGFVKMPGASKKFTIRYDEKSKRYWSLINYVSPEFRDLNPGSVRNIQALCSSVDLRDWQIHKPLLEHPDVKNHGFQYVEWLFEGDDILFLSRTAYDDEAGGARNNHDANYLTFHRISNFRELVGMQMAEGQEDFEIVKYNNPDLTVDLEVGLWPIPLPVDYDGDGLLDILVSCTSVPNKGTYFYKNIGSKSKPLFDKPVWIAEGSNAIYPSYINGELRVMKPGSEFVDFIQNRYSKVADIQVDRNPVLDIKKTRSNKWSYADYDHDGDSDILVGIDEWSDYGWDNAFDVKGNWKNGLLHGYVYLLENQGGKYINKGKILAGGKPIDTYGYPCPSLCDFDGDGDLDMICGEFVDKLTWFENTGTREKPVFEEGRYLKNKEGLIQIRLEMFVPVAIDFDEDGHIDLLAGEEDGRIAFIRNTGKVKKHMPVFESITYLQQKADNLKFGALVTPFSVDWDGDGDEDLIAGNSAGDLAFIENLSGGGNPKWNAPALLKSGNTPIHIQAGENGSIQGPCEAKWGYTVPTVADWDHDGRLDIIINSIWGEIVWYKNTGDVTKLQGPFKMKVEWQNTPAKPAWNWWDPGVTDLVTQWRTSPVAIDWNQDGLTDLVMLDHEGFLCFFERFQKGSECWLKPGKRLFYQINQDQTELLRLNEKQAGASGRRKFCFSDWDHDGDLDIIMNSTNISYFENVKQENGHVYYVDRGNMGRKKLAGHTTCPTVVDWNKDGVQDALVGAEDGHFYLLKNSNQK